MSDPSEEQPPDVDGPAPPDDPALAGGGRKKKRKRKKTKMAARRGIETMFRTAYREQLDLTALADSKANIMIQLNGVIISIMLASSGVIMDSHPWLRLPSAALTSTSLVAIVFAVLAARPSLKKQDAMTFADIKSGKSNILFFGNFARISEAQFVEGMWEMFRDSEQVYRNMTRHVHGLGSVLMRKFRLLRVAYTVFLTGLCVSSALFLYALYAFANEPRIGRPSLLGMSEFIELEDVYEPSGVVQLSDGRLLVVEDEPEQPFSLLTQGPSGRLTVHPELDFRAMLTAQHPALRNLDDLEGTAIDHTEGFVYAVTSFSSGSRSQPDREKLVRFKLDGSTLSEARVTTDLKSSLSRRVPGELNIEGLAFDPIRRRLLLGLRTPLRGGKALVVPVSLGGLFDDSPEVGEPIELDMHHEGIRAMAYDSKLDGFVLIGHNEGKSQAPFNMWLWDGEHDPRPLRVDGIDLRRAEGVAPVVLNGRKRLLIVSDEGKRKKGRTAKYILLRYDQLFVES